MNKHIRILLAAGAATILTSCETLEPTPAERHETQATISREQARLRRQSNAERSRAEELEQASRMRHRGAADGEPDTSDIDAGADEARENAAELDTAGRMMGRGAAN